MSFNKDLNVLKVGKVHIETGKEFQCSGARTHRLFVLQDFWAFNRKIDYFNYLLCSASAYLSET